MNTFKLKNTALIISLSTMLIACESDPEVDIPFEPTKLVLTSFLDPSADTNIVHLSKTDPIFDNQSSYFDELNISNGIVKISDGTNEFNLRYDANNRYYFFRRNDFNIDYNKNYSITASAINQTISKNIRTIDSSKVEIVSFNIDQSNYSDDFGTYSVYKARVEFKDPANENNFYRIYLSPIYEDIFNPGQEYDYFYDVYSNTLISDEGRNGGNIVALTEHSEYDGGFGNNITGFRLYIYKVDEDVYKYVKSLKNYTGDDPFSEPSLIYSNVPGGLGLVGSQMVFSVKKTL